MFVRSYFLSIKMISACIIVNFRIAKPFDLTGSLLIKNFLNSGADFEDFPLIFNFLVGSILATF